MEPKLSLPARLSLALVIPGLILSPTSFASLAIYDATIAAEHGVASVDAFQVMHYIECGHCCANINDCDGFIYALIGQLVGEQRKRILTGE